MKPRITIPALISLLIFFFFQSARAQDLSQNLKADTVGLSLTQCLFEKDAKAMVISDEADVIATHDSITMTRKKRIKLFKGYDNDLASVHLTYNNDYEYITDIEASTIKQVNGQVIVTRLAPELIYINKVDKYHKEIIFTFPAVDAGCVLEYKYHWKTESLFGIPDWFFQSTIPVKFSRMTLNCAKDMCYSIIEQGDEPYTIKQSDEIKRFDMYGGRTFIWAKSELHSYTHEPFRSKTDKTRQAIILTYNPEVYSIFPSSPADTWADIIYRFYTDQVMSAAMSQNISELKDFLIKIKAYPTEQKIAAIFNHVKSNLKWDETDRWYPRYGIKKTWNQKSGNSADINFILLNLLKSAGVNAGIMFVSTPDNGWIDPHTPNRYQINKTVVYVPVDSTQYYVLDASSKYNMYNEIPSSLLNTYGIYCYKDPQHSITVDYKFIRLKNEQPAIQNINTEAEISPQGKLTGTVTLTSNSYSKARYHQDHDGMSETDYINELRQHNNQISITNLSVQNATIDSLPMIQKFNFGLDSEADGNFIYFKTNLFGEISINPFLKENRYSDIDFGSNDIYKINGQYKLPEGYKLENQPQNTQLSMFDKSIIFKRLAETNGNVLTISYIIICSRTTYSRTEYSALHDFYKKMFEILNEPVVLKKG